MSDQSSARKPEEEKPEEEQKDSSSQSEVGSGEVLKLSHDWCFYCDDGNFYNGKAQNYYDQMIKLGSFNTVENFWRYFNATEETLRRLSPPKFNMRMFKVDIKPMWEDPNNRKGGKWIITCPLSMDGIMKIWKDVLLATITGFGSDTELADLCGCVLVGRRERMEVQIWTKSKPKTEKIAETVDILKGTIKEKGVRSIQFISHQKAKKKRSKRLAAAAAVISLIEEQKARVASPSHSSTSVSSSASSSTSSTPSKKPIPEDDSIYDDDLFFATSPPRIPTTTNNNNSNQENESSSTSNTNKSSTTARGLNFTSAKTTPAKTPAKTPNRSAYKKVSTPSSISSLSPPTSASKSKSKPLNPHAKQFVLPEKPLLPLLNITNSPKTQSV